MIKAVGTFVGLLCASTVTLAQPQPDIIDTLARGWTGGRSTSLCKPESAADVPVKCEWLLPQGQRVQGEVLTTRWGSDSAMISWQRDLPSLSEMHRVVDSLGTALRLRGLTMRPCRPGMVPAGTVDGRIWEDKKLLVYIAATTPASRGAPKLLIIGTDQPASYPDVVCPKRREP